MNRRGEVDAIVVGAGPVGAAQALALANDGFEVALVEARAPKPWRVEDDVDPRVVALAPDARDLLADLGVWGAITAARVGPYRHMHVWDMLAPGALDFDARERGEAELGWIVENRLIQHALLEAIGAGRGPEPALTNRGARSETRRRDFLPPRLLCPATVAGVEQDESSVVATLDDGTRLRAKLLVAAEGAESTLREQLGIAFQGRDYGVRAVVAHVGTARPHQATAWQRFRPGGPLAFLPLADGRCSVVWSLPEAEATRVLALDDSAFRAELGSALDFRLGEITSTTARFAFPLRLRLAERYVAGRCVLAGDTAHLVHPLAGQGMNLGLRDVACLRRVVREARERDSDIGANHVLRRYERERRSENTLAARGFDLIDRVFGSSSAPLAGLRGAALTLASRIGPLRRALADAAAGRAGSA